ncbi:DNA ligase [Neptunomonas japonica]|uniref:DNA ligase (ATP) n=1 Tax=Neptunomonas japonica JAMM 1380 TaxID=1441457 RepID=A0A7R6PRE9_9GAMM|nr:DNA ligase [Neptunomonas japonica]BBB29015.1 DNA ligase (ATP) [Neptunomonas japonica JAMM 1380]
MNSPFIRHVAKLRCAPHVLSSITCFALSTYAFQVNATDANILPPLQLAKSLDHASLQVDLNGYWYAEKLDGIRGYWDGEHLVTRQGNHIHAPEWFIRSLPNIAMEGELWIGRQRFDKVSSIARQHKATDSDWRSVSFFLFDLPHYPGTFEQRRTVLEKWVTTINEPHIKAVTVSTFKSQAALEEQLLSWTKQGAEGIMLYRGAGLYQAKRTDDLLKLKSYEDAEARVIEILPGKGKYQGMLGALLVEDSNGVRFRVGSGFSDAERKAPPEVGSIITYRFNGKTRYGKPRFARFERIRNDF